MLKGLEISEVLLSEMINHSLSNRIDAEFFKKRYLIEDEIIESYGSKKLVSITRKIDVGYVGSMTSHYRENGVTLLQTKNIDSFLLNSNNTVKITQSFHENLKKSQVNFLDILIARSGSFGKASIYLEKETINSSDIIIIKADESYVNPYFLTAFLNCYYGVNQMVRFASGGLQGHVNLTILEELKVPTLSLKFQNKIGSLVSVAYEHVVESKRRYNIAETILKKEIGLEDYIPNPNGINVKKLSDSYIVTRRLDAEYYQPKYDEILEKIKCQPHDNLVNIVSIKKSLEPGSKNYTEEGLPFLRVADYTKFGLTEPQKHLSDEFILENIEKIEKIKPAKGTILFSKDGSVGEAYLLRQDFNGITSSAILHLAVKDISKILPEYLTLVLNSLAVKMQAERDAGGSIILHWRVSEIENVIVPIIDYNKQKEIADLIEESFALKKKREHLLEVAKRAVEVAIESDEESALIYINQNS